MAVSAGYRHTCALLVRFCVGRSGSQKMQQGSIGPLTQTGDRLARVESRDFFIFFITLGAGPR